jgi:hypothetical protein
MNTRSPAAPAVAVRKSSVLGSEPKTTTQGASAVHELESGEESAADDAAPDDEGEDDKGSFSGGSEESGPGVESCDGGGVSEGDDGLGSRADVRGRVGVSGARREDDDSAGREDDGEDASGSPPADQAEDGSSKTANDQPTTKKISSSHSRAPLIRRRNMARCGGGWSDREGSSAEPFVG